MPPRPAYIRPGSSIHLPRYTISFLLSSNPSSLRSEPIMELRGGFIEHLVDANTSIVKFDPPTVETLAPSLGHTRCGTAPTTHIRGRLRSVDVKDHVRVREMKSRPGKWKCAHQQGFAPTFISAAMQSNDRVAFQSEGTAREPEAIHALSVFNNQSSRVLVLRRGTRPGRYGPRRNNAACAGFAVLEGGCCTRGQAIRKRRLSHDH